MKHVIIGTAGHIDHGKTTLIKALTGRDTDRLKEEKKRGITIDLGFTYFDLPSGRRAGIIDVPGHEKFIKNMLAGVMGMDIVVLVIAADEGVMPQTREHLDILSFLDIPQGLVVLTKCDLVEPEWLEMVREDVREGLEGTFLEEAEVLTVDSVSGKGMDALARTLDEMSEKVRERDSDKPARLPVDRVFSLTGYGTIVTGTLVEGRIRKGDTLQVYPGEKKVKIRNMQVHGEDVEEVLAGQRTALNLAGVKKDELSRGEVIASVDSMASARMIDVELRLTKDEKRLLENWTRLRLYHGSAEILCRLVLLDREVLSPGESCFAQLRLEKPHAFKYGDLFVVRYYSPLETIGGGMVIDPAPEKHKRFKSDVLETLDLKSRGDREEIVGELVLKASAAALDLKEIQKASGLHEEEVSSSIERLLREEVLYGFKESYMHRDRYAALEEKAIRIVNGYHEAHPYKRGISKEELKNKLLGAQAGRLFDALLERMVREGVFVLEAHAVRLKTFAIALTTEDERLAGSIEAAYEKAGFTPENLSDVRESLNIGRKEMPVLDYLIQEGRLVKVSEELLYARGTYERVLAWIGEVLKEQGHISLSEFKEAFNLSRKFAIAFLEHTDNLKLTKRDGNRRIPF